MSNKEEEPESRTAAGHSRPPMNYLGSWAAKWRSSVDFGPEKARRGQNERKGGFYENENNVHSFGIAVTFYPARRLPNRRRADDDRRRDN